MEGWEIGRITPVGTITEFDLPPPPRDRSALRSVPNGALFECVNAWSILRNEPPQ
jgi:hypothetical protein